ncbi:hypothetical protein [Luteimonas arsenica]|uniref:hypothetical protein n=1 Tax=Luteimonas arsenica TaxID=1586242 RepID=UPI0010567099|nr:hypothetical protein [Luteimonas arsenica]
MSNQGRRSSTWLFFSALLFMILGLASNPLFFVVAIFLFSAAQAGRDKTVGIVGMAFGRPVSVPHSWLWLRQRRGTS